MSYPYDIDIEIGRILGREKSCIGKKRYTTKEAVMDAKDRHNRSVRMFHKVHGYLCPFCTGYHVGRQPTIKDVKFMLRRYEHLVELIDNWFQADLRYGNNNNTTEAN